MTLMTCLVFVMIIWGVGFFGTNLSELDLDAKRKRKLIQVPSLLFILFGRPTTKRFPPGVMLVQGVWLQSSAFLMIVYWLFRWRRGEELGGIYFAIGVFGSFVLGYVLAKFLHYRWPYSAKDKKSE